jgi:hypothetical protein
MSEPTYFNWGCDTTETGSAVYSLNFLVAMQNIEQAANPDKICTASQKWHNEYQWCFGTAGAFLKVREVPEVIVDCKPKCPQLSNPSIP